MRGERSGRFARWMVACAIALAALPAAHAADDATELGLLLETRQGIATKGGDPALDEWRARLDGRMRIDGGPVLKASLSALTESRLDTSRFNRVEFDALHATWTRDACSLRTGVQTVVWGQADRLRVVDVVHPMDLRESGFGDWERKRLPLGMLNLECTAGDQGLQLLVVPQTRFDRLPGPQGRFAVPQPSDLAAAAGVPVDELAEPSATRPADWNGGARWSARVFGADVALHAYRGWEHQLRLTPSADGRLTAAPDRMSMVGASFAAPLGAVVLRGELGAYRGVTVPVVGAAGTLDATQSDQLSALLGADWVGKRWTVSGQLYSRDGDEPAGALTPVRQRMATGALRRGFMGERLSVGGYVAIDLERSASYLSLDAQYEWSRRTVVQVVAERFAGDASSFGRFDAQDRVMLRLRIQQ